MNTGVGRLLDIRGIKRTFGIIEVVHGVDLSIGWGEVVALVGPTGSGKSTLLGLVSGHLDCDEGVVTFKGEDVTRLSALQRVAKGLVRVFDIGGLFDDLTVGDHVLAVGRNSAPTSTDLYEQWQVDSQYLRRGLRSLGLAGLNVLIETPVHSLTLAQKHLLAFGLTALDPFDLVLWDEPFSGLKGEDTEALRYLLGIQKADGKSVLLTTAREDLPRGVVDRVLTLS